MNFQEAKAKHDEISARHDAASAAIRAFPKVGNLGLTPNSVRQSGEFVAAKIEYDSAFQALRQFNSWYVRTFAKELRAERRKRVDTRACKE